MNKMDELRKQIIGNDTLLSEIIFDNQISFGQVYLNYKYDFWKIDNPNKGFFDFLAEEVKREKEI